MQSINQSAFFLKFRVVFLLVFFFMACKKNTSDEAKPTSPAGSRMQLTQDSIYLYAKQVYLWNDAIPSYEVFNPRRYTQSTNELTNLEKEVFDLSQFKKNPATGISYEFKSTEPGTPKFSYIELSESTGIISGTTPKVNEVDLDGVGTDFGFALSQAFTSATTYKIYIRYVNPGSPAYNNGLRRGDWLEKIGTLTLPATTNGQTPNLTQSQVNFINSALNSTSPLTLIGKKADGSAFNKTLTRSTYSSRATFKDTVITSSGTKIGYLALARFSDIDNFSLTGAPLKNAFSRFQTNGVTNLVIDLRYNGGGYVETARLLANLIAGKFKAGATMFSEHFNSTLQNRQATILKNQPLPNSSGIKANYFDNYDYSVSKNTYPFNNQSESLNSVTKIVFLVSSSTASASELVINVLKPHISNLKIISSEDENGNANTYGKPVGFFPIKIDKYDVYFSMFETKNSLGQGSYYNGLTPDAVSNDDVTRDFGDPEEDQFASAIRYIVSNTLSAKAPGARISLVKQPTINLGIDNSFKGMIEGKRK